MLDQDLKRIWQEINSHEAVFIDDKILTTDLITKVRDFEASIRKRDKTEVYAAVLVIVIFGLMGYIVPWTMSKIGAFLLIPYALFIIWMLKKVKKYKNEDLALSLNDYLKQYLTYLKEEKQLLTNILYWYILPGLIPLILFIAGFGDSTVMKVFIVLIILIVNFYIYYLNQQSVRKLFNPLIEEIEAMLEKVEKEQEESK